MNVNDMIAEAVDSVRAGRIVGATIIDGSNRHEVGRDGVTTVVMTPEEVRDWEEERAFWDAREERKAARRAAERVNS